MTEQMFLFKLSSFQKHVDSAIGDLNSVIMEGFRNGIISEKEKKQFENLRATVYPISNAIVNIRTDYEIKLDKRNA